MQRLKIEPIGLEGVYVIKRTKLSDARGFLDRLFCQDELYEFGFKNPIKQINHTRTEKSGTTRGLHAQRKPYREIKLVSCIKGAILDIVVDVRPNSKTFLQWKSIELSENNDLSIIIPEGFAHGFQTLRDNAEVLYMHTAPYAIDSELNFNILDPMIGIKLPLPISEISNKDKSAKYIDLNLIEVLNNEM